MSTAKPEDVESLIRLFDESDWDALRISSPDYQIHLSKDASHADVSRKSVAGAPAASAASVVLKPVVSRPSTAAGSAADEIPEGMVAVRAPHLGTFYRSPKPGSEPYVSVGLQVEANTEVGMIEVMKLFTAVHAGVSGIVRQIVVEDAQMVEFDQPLLVIEPNG